MTTRAPRPGELTFLGTGEAFDQDLPNTSVLCCFGPTFLVDCGLGIPPRVWQVLSDPDQLDAVYLTHLHADHVFGVPSVLFRLWEDGRRRPLAIMGPRGVETYLSRLLHLAYRIKRADLPYPVNFMTAESGGSLTYRGIRLSFARSKHSIPNLAVRFDWKGKGVVVSGDGSPTAATEQLFRGCSLLVHETYQDEVSEPVHASLPSVIATAHRAGVKRLYLVHLSRRFRESAAARVEQYRPRAMQIRIARPGQIVRV